MFVNYMRIGKEIKRARLKCGWSQAMLAEKVGLSTQYLSQIETGKKKASLQSVYSIARVLGASIDNLTGNEVYRSEEDSSALEQLLQDCSIFEHAVLLDLLKAAKKILRTNEDLI